MSVPIMLDSTHLTGLQSCLTGKGAEFPRTHTQVSRARPASWEAVCVCAGTVVSLPPAALLPSASKGDMEKHGQCNHLMPSTIL